jgi:3-deoxy-manno-octulosonate cytidylyltransferase (CMP-KDO synthetase)
LFRSSKDPISNSTYHHIGIYAFTNKALIRYVGLKRSKLEIKRKLEQLRALDNKMKIEVGYLDSLPLSVDTEEDLIKVKKNMEN